MDKYALVFVLLCSFTSFSKCLNLPIERTEAARNNVIEDIYFRFYTGSTVEENVDIRLSRSQDLFLQPKFNKKNPTVFYIHGFNEKTEQESVRTVVGAYLEARPDTNIVLVDWSNMGAGSYFVNAAPNTKKVARAVAVEIKNLVDGGLDLPLIHIVGHSLGGQIAGFTGRELQNLGIKAKRISALDPAFPEFYPGLLLSHIDATDAEFVDIIHTDAGSFGAPVATGTVDFWPNGGRSKQPGCSTLPALPLSDNDLCSHWRSWWFWSESVRNPLAFPAVPAKSYFQFKVENTKQGISPVVYMGINADRSSSGNYYLMTNDRSPYGRGMEGTYYK